MAELPLTRSRAVYNSQLLEVPCVDGQGAVRPVSDAAGVAHTGSTEAALRAADGPQALVRTPTTWVVVPAIQPQTRKLAL